MDLLKISILIIAVTFANCTHTTPKSNKGKPQSSLVFRYSQGQPKTDPRASWKQRQAELKKSSVFQRPQPQIQGPGAKRQGTTTQQGSQYQPYDANQQYNNQQYNNQQYYNQNQQGQYSNQYQPYNGKTTGSNNYQDQTQGQQSSYTTGQDRRYYESQTYKNQYQNYNNNQQYRNNERYYYNYDTTTRASAQEYYQGYNTESSWVKMQTSPPSYYGTDPTGPTQGSNWDTPRQTTGGDRWVEVGSLKNSWTTEALQAAKQVKKEKKKVTTPKAMTVPSTSQKPKPKPKVQKVSTTTQKAPPTKTKKPPAKQPPIISQVQKPKTTMASQTSVANVPVITTTQPPVSSHAIKTTTPPLPMQVQNITQPPSTQVVTTTKPPPVYRAPETTTPVYIYTTPKTYPQSTSPPYVERPKQYQGAWTTQPPMMPTVPVSTADAYKRWKTEPPYTFTTTPPPLYATTQSFWDSMFNVVPTTPFPGNKRGICPSAFIVMFDCPARCYRDSDCYGPRKCCHDGSGHGCCSKTNDRIMRWMMPILMGGEVSGFMHRGRYYGEGGRGAQAEAGMK